MESVAVEVCIRHKHSRVKNDLKKRGGGGCRRDGGSAKRMLGFDGGKKREHGTFVKVLCLARKVTKTITTPAAHWYNIRDTHHWVGGGALLSVFLSVSSHSLHATTRRRCSWCCASSSHKHARFSCPRMVPYGAIRRSPAYICTHTSCWRRVYLSLQSSTLFLVSLSLSLSLLCARHVLDVARLDLVDSLRSRVCFTAAAHFDLTWQKEGREKGRGDLHHGDLYHCRLGLRLYGYDRLVFRVSSSRVPTAGNCPNSVPPAI